MIDPWMTPKEAAKILHCTPRTARNRFREEMIDINAGTGKRAMYRLRTSVVQKTKEYRMRKRR